MEPTNHQESQPPKMETAAIVDLLVELIEFNFDSYYGYNTAAEAVENQQYQDILQEHAQQRLGFAQELNELITVYGGSPIEGGHVIGQLHRAWMQIKAVLSEDDYAILSECAQAEELVMRAYQIAMDQPIPDDVRNMVRHQMSETRVTAKKIQDLVAILKQQRNKPSL